MKLFTVVGIGLCGLALHLLLESVGRRDMALLSTAACGIMLMLCALEPAKQIVTSVTDMAARTGIDDPTVQLMLRITGMALLTELAAQLCRDTGTGALAQKIELAGKGMILCAALPVLEDFTAAALQLLS